MAFILNIYIKLLTEIQRKELVFNFEENNISNNKRERKKNVVFIILVYI